MVYGCCFCLNLTIQHGLNPGDKIQMFKKIKTLIALTLLLLPTTVFGQIVGVDTGTKQCTDPGNGPHILNPLAGNGICSIPDLINFLVELFVGFIGLMGVVAIIISGYEMVYGSGD